jgi:hypothetical protein
MRRALSFSALAFVSACASAPKPEPVSATESVPPPPPATAPSVAPPPAPVEAQPAVTPPAPKAEKNHSVAFAIPRPHEWTDRPIAEAKRMRSYTPDAVIGNGTTGALLAFASVPATLGSAASIATGMRDQMRKQKKTDADVVMEAASGERASFTFECEAKDGSVSRGKVVVTKAPGLDSQYVLIVGEWPEESDTTSVADVDVIARSIAATAVP